MAEGRTRYSFDELCPYIREAGLQHKDAWRNKKRKIYDHQFLYCFKGTANVLIEERKYKIKKGDIVIIHPDTAHELWFDEDLSGELYWFHCDFFYYEDKDWHYDFYQNAETYLTMFGHNLLYPEHIRVNPVFNDGYQIPEVVRLTQSNEVEYLFRKIVKSYIAKEPYWQILAKVYLLDVLKQIFSQTNNNKVSKKQYVIDTIKNCISHNYYRKLTVDEICRETGLNTEYASKVFRQETGEKVVECLNRHRIEQAKKLFLEVDLNIMDVSEMVGFNNENYFSSVFKKYEGKTPLQSRNELLRIFNNLNDT